LLAAFDVGFFVLAAFDVAFFEDVFFTLAFFAEGGARRVVSPYKALLERSFALSSHFFSHGSCIVTERGAMPARATSGRAPEIGRYPTPAAARERSAIAE